MCGLFDAPKAPKIETPAPEPAPAVFKAGSEKDNVNKAKPSSSGKSSLKNPAVGLGIPTGG